MFPCIVGSLFISSTGPVSTRRNLPTLFLGHEYTDIRGVNRGFDEGFSNSFVKCFCMFIRGIPFSE